MNRDQFLELAWATEDTDFGGYRFNTPYATGCDGLWAVADVAADEREASAYIATLSRGALPPGILAANYTTIDWLHQRWREEGRFCSWAVEYEGRDGNVTYGALYELARRAGADDLACYFFDTPAGVNCDGIRAIVDAAEDEWDAAAHIATLMEGALPPDFYPANDATEEWLSGRWEQYLRSQCSP